MKPVPVMRPLLFGMVFLAAVSVAHAGSVMISGGPVGAISVDVKSIQEAKFRNTVRQQYDYSCGSAAVATLLSYHYDDPVSEQVVFKEMWDAGDRAKIRREGFSLLDMKNYLEAHGYEADGYKVSLDRLAAVGVPAITIMNLKGYMHFVVIKGITEKEVLVSDPAAGNAVISRTEFESGWNGILFLVRSKKNVAARHFNREQDWRIKERAPFGVAMSAGEIANVPQFLPAR